MNYFISSCSSGKTYLMKLAFELCNSRINNKVQELKEKDKKLGEEFIYAGSIAALDKWKKQKDKIKNQIEILEELLCQNKNGVI